MNLLYVLVALLVVVVVQAQRGHTNVNHTHSERPTSQEFARGVTKTHPMVGCSFPQTAKGRDILRVFPCATRPQFLERKSEFIKSGLRYWRYTDTGRTFLDVFKFGFMGVTGTRYEYLNLYNAKPNGCTESVTPKAETPDRFFRFPADSEHFGEASWGLNNKIWVHDMQYKDRIDGQNVVVSTLSDNLCQPLIINTAGDCSSLTMFLDVSNTFDKEDWDHLRIPTVCTPTARSFD